MTNRLPASVRVGYAAGSLATGAFSTVPGLLLLPYLTDTLGVFPVLAGVFVLLPKAWDVVFNPVAGRISDRTRDARGPRRPYLLWGGVALAVLFAAIFAHPAGYGSGAVIWVVALFLLAATAFAFYQVPYVALPAEITEDPAERTRLMTRRIAVLAVAILAAGAGAPAIRDAVGGVDGYRLMGIAMGALILIGALWAYRGTRAAPIGEVRPSAVGWRQTFAALREAPRFTRLLIVFVVQAVGIGTMLAGVDYVARVVLLRPGASSLLFAAFVGPALLVMPLWQWAAGRWSKVVCFVAASGLFAAGAVGVGIVTLLTRGSEAAFGWTVYTPLADGPSLVGVPLSAGAEATDLAPFTSNVALTTAVPLAVIIGLVVVIGIGYAGQQVFALSLLADFSAEAETRTGRKRAGLFAGVWTAGETFGLALGPGIFGLMLSLGDYQPGLSEGAAELAVIMQPPSAVTAIAIGFTLIPAFFVLIALPLLRRRGSGGGSGDGPEPGGPPDDDPAAAGPAHGLADDGLAEGGEEAA